jgi:hypothetical protein
VPGKTPREAVKAYLEPLQKNVAIVCNGVLRVNNYDKLDEVSVLTLEPVPLNGRSDLYLSFTQQLRSSRTLRMDRTGSKRSITVMQLKRKTLRKSWVIIGIRMELVP